MRLDSDAVTLGGLFPIPEAMLGRTKRLVGTTAPNEQGMLLKMSKSLNNAIFLSDDADTVKKKIMGMYTDPNRLRATDPGTVENNPLWIFHDTFNADTAWVEEAKASYRAGTIGDVACKKVLIDVINNLLEPMRERRAAFEAKSNIVKDVLAHGAEKANAIANETLAQVSEKMALSKHLI